MVRRSTLKKKTKNQEVQHFRPLSNPFDWVENALTGMHVGVSGARAQVGWGAFFPGSTLKVLHPRKPFSTGKLQEVRIIVSLLTSAWRKLPL